MVVATAKYKMCSNTLVRHAMSISAAVSMSIASHVACIQTRFVCPTLVIM